MGLELMVVVRVDLKPMSEIGTSYYHVDDSATPWRARRHTGKRNLGRNDNASEEPYEKGNWRAQLLDTQDGRIFEVTATDGVFEFTGIPIGSYVLQAYLDLNSNQKWDPGQLQPWAPAETWLRLPLVFPLKSGVQELSDLFNTLER